MAINLEDIDYSIQYENWHSEETRDTDIKAIGTYLKQHSLYPANKDSNILDIGCGYGNLLSNLSMNGYKNYKGIDVDASQVKYCQDHGLKTVDNISTMDFFDKSSEIFDSIFLLDVLEHIPKSEQLFLLKNIFNALSDDGMLTISVPNALSPLAYYYVNIDWTHYCCFSPISLRFILKNAGFKYFVFRPSHHESLKLRELKKPWVDLYKEEFGIEKPILTPAIVAVCFKSKSELNKYLENAEDLMQFDEEIKPTFLQKLKSKIKSLLINKI